MSLQKFALACVIGAFSLLVHMSASAQERTLADVMSLMGRSFGGLARPVNAGTAGAPEAQLTRQVLALTLEAQGLLPDSVTSLPDAEREVRAQLYVDLMGELARALEELEAAITVADPARSKAALQWILQLRTKGHEEFRI